MYFSLHYESFLCWDFRYCDVTDSEAEFSFCCLTLTCTKMWKNKISLVLKTHPPPTFRFTPDFVHAFSLRLTFNDSLSPIGRSPGSLHPAKMTSLQCNWFCCRSSTHFSELNAKYINITSFRFCSAQLIKTSSAIARSGNFCSIPYLLMIFHVFTLYIVTITWDMLWVCWVLIFSTFIGSLDIMDKDGTMEAGLVIVRIILCKSHDLFPLPFSHFPHETI